MSLYYPTSNCGGGAIPSYYCNPCLDSTTIEYGRVRSIAFVKNTYLSTIIANPSSTAVWTTAVNSGNAIVLYQTRGSYDGSNTTMVTGFGDNIEFNGTRTHTLTYFDPFCNENIDFYNAIQNSTDYTIVWRTSSRIWFAGTPVTITAKIPVADDIASTMTVEVTCKWTNSSIPTPYATPASIFDRCYIV